MPSVLICVQARSGSKRLPGKSLSLIEDMTMVARVLNSAKCVVRYFDSSRATIRVHCHLCLAVPFKDPLIAEFKNDVYVVEGDEEDVFSRYVTAFKKYDPDYLVRLTGDCPEIIPNIISKHITCALSKKLDYLSNTIGGIRTHIDGQDVEVISKAAFSWLMGNVKDAHDKEHVTTLLKEKRPQGLKMGAVLAPLDLSEFKISVDTIEELQAARKRTSSLKEKHNLARELGYDITRF